MPLDPDAQAVMDVLMQSRPPGPQTPSVEESRALIAEMAKQTPRGPEVARVEDRQIAFDGHDIPVRIYWPSSEPDLPALVWLHGGAFALGTVDMSDPTARQLAVGAGVVVVSVEYRLAPEHKFPAGVEDCYAAAAWVAKNATEIGVNPDRVAIGGDSAGGTLAASVALMARDRNGPNFAFQLLVYPTTSMRVSSYEYVDDPFTGASMVNYFWNQYVQSDADFASPYCAPLAAESLAGLPPAFVVIPEVDITRGDQEAYAQRLAAAGVLTTYKVYSGVFHGFFSIEAIAKGRQAVADATRVLQLSLHPAARVGPK
jgi:acetyl esterase